MQNLSDLPNIALKSDLVQQVLHHLEIRYLVPFAFLSRQWREEWKFNLRTRCFKDVTLDSGGIEVDEERTYESGVDAANIIPSPIFTDKTNVDSGPNAGRMPILRQFFLLVLGCRRLRWMTLDFRDKTVDERLASLAIEREFPGQFSGDYEKISVECLIVSSDQLFCLKWFRCPCLYITWADSGYVVDLDREWQCHKREIKRFFFYLLGDEKTEDGIHEMVQQVFNLVGQKCRGEKTVYRTDHLLAGFSATRHDDTGFLCIFWKQTFKDDDTATLEIRIVQVDIKWKDLFH